jgi:hypothetical protein
MRFAVPALLGLGLFLGALPPRAVAADPFAASVLSCAAEADRDRRLDCYDRAVANFTAGLSRGADSKPGMAVSPSSVAAPGVGRSGGETGTAAAAAAAQSGLAAQSAATTQPGATVGQTAAGNAATNGNAGSAGAAPRHVTARVVSVDYLPDHMIVHLDNNQVWQQVAEASTELTIHAGHTVNIDKQMGSYWLSGRKGDSTVQVKQKQ